VGINEFLSFFLSHGVQSEEFSGQILREFLDNLFHKFDDLDSGFFGTNGVEREHRKVSGASDSC
jgi:hypothetical protein